MKPVKRLEMAKVYLTTKQVAEITGYSSSWCRTNKHKFNTVRTGKIIKYPLVEVLRIANLLNEEVEQYQAAS